MRGTVMFVAGLLVMGLSHVAVSQEFPTEADLKYIRVIQIPSPRWTAYDAKFFGIQMPDYVPMTITDRAYTSPIWYAP
jgi:hypothetical protein